MDAREFLQPLLSRLSEERSLAAFVVLYFVGVHWLTGARRWWTKLPGALCLAASVPFWMHALRFSPSELGPNAATLSLGAGFVAIAGLWLFLSGNGPVEVLAGFLIAAAAAAIVLFAIGQWLTALACAAALIPAGCAFHWFATSPSNEQSAASAAERAVSTVASSALALALALALTIPPPALSPSTGQQPRIRDFLTQPATLLLIAVASAVSASAWSRLLRTEREQ